MNRLPRLMMISTVCAVLLAPPVLAQDVGTMPLPMGEVSVGYAFMKDFTDLSDIPGGPNHPNFPAGWYVSGGINVNQWLGIVGEGGGTQRTFDVGPLAFPLKVQVYTFMAGPRFFHKAGRLVPFGQFLAGGANARFKMTLPTEYGGVYKDDTTEFAIQPGGGVTYLLSEHVGLRAEADYRCIIDFEDENDYTNEFRFVSGFTFHWGAR